MGEDARPPRSPSQAELRAVLREYVKWTLYASAPRGVAPPPLCLPYLHSAVYGEEDVYAARPGHDDPRAGEDGRPLPRLLLDRGGVTTLARGASDRDPVLNQASHAAGWRRFLEQQELAPALLRLERETVLQLVNRLRPRDQQALWDIAHCTVPQAAHRHQCSPAAIKQAAREALNRLLDRLYASNGGSRSEISRD